MENLKNYADRRLLSGCVYCDGPAETRDHVPSRCLLERPFPENLPVVGCCEKCNQSFSKDEEYFVCLVECVLAGSTDSDKIKRPSVARIMRNSVALRKHIESAKRVIDGQTLFVPDPGRVESVMLKLARGHAAFELGHVRTDKPDHFWCNPIELMHVDLREAFNSGHMQKLFGEIGSRNYQRTKVINVTLQSQVSGEQQEVGLWVNEWIDVQDGLYRYLAIDDVGGIVIRIVVAEYLACEIAWND